jgi:hypothetical protein
MTDPGYKIFLLSPARPTGVRASQLTARRARFATAERFRSPEGVPIGEAFAFLSALYFRGKIAYARRFAAPPEGGPAGLGGVFVIAPGFGLVPPEWPLTPKRMEKLRRTPVAVANRSYARPLLDHALALDERLPPGARVVLLGSVATGKYVDLLRPALGERLFFPRLFAGAGDMRRGSLLLNAVRDGIELEYAPVAEPRRRRS